MAKKEEAKKKVLVVDDEPDIRQLVRTILEKANGYAVSEAVNGNDCLKKLGKNPDVNLVLLDIRMPGIPPKEVIESIQKNAKLRKVKIAYLTVVQFSDEIIKNVLRQKQVVDYITKPFRAADLVARVRKAIG